jgi:hypothetical protein
MISPVRFFAVAPLHSRYMLMALAAVLVSGLAMLLVDPAKGGDPVAPLILLQMLAASSGFAVGARRGHLDLLLTAGPSRVNIALVHLAASVLPGVLVWLALAATEAAARGTSRPRAFASGTVLAMMAVSILAWALTVPLPRLSGGIAWLLGIAMWVVGWSGGPAVLAAAPGGEAGTALRAVVVTLCPFVLVGHRLTMRDAPAITPLVLLSLFLGIAAVVWIARMDVSVESAQ